MSENIPDITDNRNCISYSQEVQGAQEILYTWDGSTFCWDDASMYGNLLCWDDIRVIFRAGKIDSMEDFYNFPDEDKKRFITLTCKVNGYSQTKETKEYIERTITLDDIKFTVNEVLKSIDIKIKN